ncbi:MAG TPA: flagellar basal-body rod protein FlgF [Candidatus Saccharimonadales bacterium]|nr:flagellar basal-body rod protein FlgF [Candidatus Saccharimonadales bacterium]
MLEGLRRAQQGVLPRIAQQEALANNLANSLTPGFKRDKVSFQAVLEQAAAAGSPAGMPGGASYSTLTHSRPDLRPGTMEQTGSPLDLAIEGNAYFVVQTPAGERYTRAGNFTLNAAGELAMPDGTRVLGDGGPIRVEGQVTVSPDGQVSTGGTPSGRLRLVKFPEDAQLTREGSAVWASPVAPSPATGASVKQGFLEGSNVNPVEEMVELLQAFRSYESNIKSASLQDNTLGTLVNNVGRSR